MTQGAAMDSGRSYSGSRTAGATYVKEHQTRLCIFDVYRTIFKLARSNEKGSVIEIIYITIERVNKP